MVTSSYGMSLLDSTAELAGSTHGLERAASSISASLENDSIDICERFVQSVLFQEFSKYWLLCPGGEGVIIRPGLKDVDLRGIGGIGHVFVDTGAATKTRAEFGSGHREAR
jgi:hypothetical protein